MRKLFLRKLILIAGLMALGSGIFVHSVFSRAANSSPTRAPIAFWTVMVYMVGDNDWEWREIRRFTNLGAGSSVNVSTVVQFDRIAGYDSSYDDWTGARRFYITRGMKPTIANTAMDMGEVNMGDPAVLVDFINWAKTNYPARNYALILSGPINKNVTNSGKDQEKKAGTAAAIRFNSFCPDETSGGDCLSLTESAWALEQTGGCQLIFFDCEFMNLLEAAYQVREYSQVMLGVGNLFPGTSCYGCALDELLNYYTMTPAEVGCCFAGANYWNCDEFCGSQTLLDQNRMGTMAETIDSLARAMIDYWDADRSVIRQAAQAVMTEINTSAISCWGKAYREKPLIYFPMEASDFDPGYSGATIDFAAHTLWDEFLQEFYDAMKGSWIWQVRQRYGENLYNFSWLLTQRIDEYYTESRLPNSFNGGGIPQEFHSDYGWVTYHLPFDFPYFKEVIPAGTPIYIGCEGYVSLLDPEYYYIHNSSTGALIWNKLIAPCWGYLYTNGSAQPGEDVYITENTDNLVIRWAGETYYEGVPVDFEVVLFADGRIQFNYGSSNSDLSPWDYPPAIGISRGGGIYYYISAYNQVDSLTYADSVLYTPLFSPAITVTRPLGGETYTAGSHIPVEWDAADIYSGAVRIVLKGSGTSAAYELDPAAPYNGSPRTYVIPCNVTTGTYLIRVVQDAVSGKSETFTVNSTSPCLAVTKPRGGEAFHPGSKMTIKWNSRAISGTLRINLRKSDGSVVYPAASSIPYTSSPYYYTIPAGVAAGDYFIRIKQGSTLSADSPLFTISQ